MSPRPTPGWPATTVSGIAARPLVQRLAWGIACGVAAFALNQIPAPIVSSASPEFAFGGALVLLAFQRLGVLPGIVATAIGFASWSGVAEVTVLAIMLYAIEGFVVAQLATRTRSLVVADMVFWLTGGALLDAVAAIWWLQLPAGYLLLLLVKQLMNGTMNAVVAEWLSRSQRVRMWLGLPAESTRTWHEVLFDRTVPLVMVPVTIIALLLARASNIAAMSETSAQLRRAAAAADEVADQFLQSRLSTMEDLNHSLLSLGSSSETRRAGLLRVFDNAHPELLSIVVTNAAGVVTTSAPETSLTGELLKGRDLSAWSYFRLARDTNRPAFGEIVLGQLLTGRTGAEPILPLAVPLTAAQGGFGGVVMGALDASALRSILTARVGNDDRVVQLLDRSGRVVASSSPAWKPGEVRRREVREAAAGLSDDPRPIAAPGDESYVGLLGVSPRLTLAMPLATFPFSVLVEEPLSTVHRALMPTSAALVVLMLVGLLAVYAVARRLGGQLVAPLQSIGAVAEDLADGHPVPREILQHFGESSVQEIRTLGAQFQRMDDALRARRDSDAHAVQASETKYRETLEQLAQAQKMEGIGRLAGGIAHDFNNLLTPIVGYTDLAIAGVPADSPARKDMSLVRTAAGRAKEVVAQLLAFGRAQVLDTRRLDLADAVAEFEPLLRKSLSVNHDLVVVAQPGVEVEADRAKVQQVLMNLVLNAADAMPDGGRVEVHVTTEDHLEPDPSDPEPLPAGRYGVISVGDFGVGMDEATRQRAFDPFFTTKPRGKGTGLGLSTAYGIARQHRGSIFVESAVGVGTRMRVLLPLAQEVPHLVTSALPLPDVLLNPAVAVEDGARTLLVVEDEGAVRELVRTALTRAGYRVLAARDGEEALTRAAAHAGRIDLLVTDVVMPGLNGRELALRFRQARPDARVLFMSGFAADVIAEDGGLSGDSELLLKPFTPDELLSRVRAALSN
ncbi:MAG: response regulator [Gemmatimonadaceae bacterium]|nr:response regulator [Gemmatimonadaceae bacterium]